MNHDIPYLHCWVRLEFVSDAEGFEEGYAFAIQSFKGRAIGFHVMLRSGAHYRNVPLHALCLNKDAAPKAAKDLAYWDCFSFKPVVTVFDYLRSHECLALLPDQKREAGRYLFTVDWLPDDPCHPGFLLEPDQNKCGHVLALESGNLAMLPTNKVAWRDGYFIGKDPHPEKMGYKVQTDVYRAEFADRDFSQSEAYFY